MTLSDNSDFDPAHTEDERMKRSDTTFEASSASESYFLSQGYFNILYGI